MSTVSFRRKTLLFLVAAVLAAPWASVAAPRTESPQPDQAVDLAPLEFLGRVWSFLRSIWDKDGCHIDSLGLCPTGTDQPLVQAKEGCNIDPNGHCEH